MRKLVLLAVLALGVLWAVPALGEPAPDGSVPWPGKPSPQFWWCVDWHCVRLCMAEHYLECLHLCYKVCHGEPHCMAKCVPACMTGLWGYCIHECWIC